jgi:hypothetical protein
MPNIMGRNDNGCVLGNVPGCFLCTLLHNEAAKSPEINIIAGYH